MAGGLCECFGAVDTKGSLVIYGCTVVDNGEHVSMDICFICWLSWYICVRSEVISTYLAYIWSLRWELESERLDIDALSAFVVSTEYKDVMYMLYSLSSTMVTVYAFNE